MQSSQNILLGTAALSVGILVVSAVMNRDAPRAGRMRRLADALFSKAGGSGAAVVHGLPFVPAPELREVGAVTASGDRQFMSKRLYMQLRVLDLATNQTVAEFAQLLKAAMAARPYVLYREALTSNGVGLLTWSEDPSFFVNDLNGVLESLKNLFVERVGWTMFGKTYSNGHEKDLDEFLFKKPIRAAQNEKWDWAIWYPLKRRGPFYIQPAADQCRMLLAHAGIGKSFADVGAAHDIRLKCFGIDPLDNEYVIGLCGDDVHNLSRVVEEMRKTQHTAEFLERLGPFFVGKKINE